MSYILKTINKDLSKYLNIYIQFITFSYIIKVFKIKYIIKLIKYKSRKFGKFYNKLYKLNKFKDFFLINFSIKKIFQYNKNIKV